jgi:hypothetical protein
VIRPRGGARGRQFLLLVLLAAAVLRPLAARAQTAAPAVDAAHPRIVLLSITDDDPLAARLAAELEALGLQVTRALINPTAAIEDMVKEALTAGARGVVVADGRRTEFWIAEEGSDRVAMRQELEIENTPALESVLSLRTVEFLRVSLGLAGPGPHVPPPVVAPPPAAPRPPDPRVAIALTSGVVASTGSIAPFAVVAAAARVRVAGPLGIEVRGAAPFGADRQSSATDAADVSVWLAGGGLVLAPRTAGPLRAELGAGALAAVVRAVGVPQFPTAASTDQVVGVAAYGRASGHVRLGPHLGVRLELLGGSTALQRPIVTFIDEGKVPSNVDVAVWGIGFVSLLGGVEATF